MRLDVLLGENGAAGRDPTHERQTHLLAQGILELDATRSSRNEFQDTFFLQRTEVFLGRVGRPETELTRDLGTRRRHPGFGDKLLNHIENL